MKHLLPCALIATCLAACAAPPAERPSSERADLALPASAQWSMLNTPEDAAAELFRAYINLDPQRFQRAVARPFGDSRTRAHYERFVDAAAEELRRARATGFPPEGAPVDLLEVRPARDLPSTFRSPAAYDQMANRTARLVEVEAYLAGRGIQTSRVLVLKDSAGRWGAAPRPELFGFMLN
jgi:hypothetical protein